MVTDGRVSLARLDFDSVGGVTPFTYRDSATYASMLAQLVDGLNSVINTVNEHGDNIEAIVPTVNSAFAGIETTINKSFEDFESAIQLWFSNVQHDGGSIYDPTTGALAQPFGLVLAHVYDNLRIFGWTALQYDTFNWTVGEYDAKAYTARQYDLGADVIDSNGNALPFHEISYELDGTPYLVGGNA